MQKDIFATKLNMLVSNKDFTNEFLQSKSEGNIAKKRDNTKKNLARELYEECTHCGHFKSNCKVLGIKIKNNIKIIPVISVNIRNAFLFFNNLENFNKNELFILMTEFDSD